jgi:hypothetical protein
VGQAENVAYVGAKYKLFAGRPKEIDKFKGLSVDGERIVRLVFRKLR